MEYRYAFSFPWDESLFGASNIMVRYSPSTHYCDRQQLAPKIRPNYIAAIEEQVYEMSGEASLLLGIPDVSVQGYKKQHPAYLIKSGQSVIVTSSYLVPYYRLFIPLKINQCTSTLRVEYGSCKPT